MPFPFGFVGTAHGALHAQLGRCSTGASQLHALCSMALGHPPEGPGPRAEGPRAGARGGMPSAASLAIYPSIITVHATATQYQYPLAASTARVISNDRFACFPVTFSRTTPHHDLLESIRATPNIIFR